MSTTSQTDFLLSAADVSWGRQECSTFDFSGVSTVASLAGDYITFNSPASHGAAETLRYFWFDQTGSNTDPAPSGAGTGTEIDISSAADVSAAVAAIVAAIDGVAGIKASVSSSSNQVFIVESQFIGAATAADASNASGASVSRTVTGIGGSLGKTDGGVEVSMETTTVQITADQTAGIILDEVLTGNTVEVSMSLLEMTAERWETVVGSVVGDTYTPSSGTQLVGIGTSRVYQSLFDLGGLLILHPSRFADSDRSKDIVLWKAAPKPSSINFSGSEPQVMEVTFSGLSNSNVQEAINIMSFGDHQQDVDA